MQKIPYMLVAGDREAAEGTIAVRSRSGGDQGATAVNSFIEAALLEIRNKGVLETAAAKVMAGSGNAAR